MLFKMSQHPAELHDGTNEEFLWTDNRVANAEPAMCDGAREILHDIPSCRGLHGLSWVKCQGHVSLRAVHDSILKYSINIYICMYV